MLNLGDINFGVGADTSALNRSIQDIVKFGDSVTAAAKSTAEGSDAVAAAFARQERAAMSALQSTLNLQQRIANSSGNETLIDQTTTAFESFSGVMTSGALDSLTFQRAQETLAASMGDVRRQLTQTTEAIVQMDSVITQIPNSGLKTVIADIVGIRTNFLEAAGSAEVFMNAAKGGGAINTTNAQLAGMINELNGVNRAYLSAAESAQVFMRNGVTPIKNSGLSEILRDMSASATLMVGPLSGIGARFGALSAIFSTGNLLLSGTVAGFAAVTAGAVALSSGAIDVAQKLTIVEQRLLSIGLTSSQAEAELSHLSDQSNRLGINFLSSADAFSKFAAAANGSGASFKQVQDIFDTFSALGAKLHLSQEQMQSVFLALEQMISKGTVSSEELRKQLANALPGAMTLFAQSIDVPTSALNKLLKAGVLPSLDSLQALSDQIKKTYNVNDTTTIDSLVASQERYANSLTNLYSSFDQAFKVSVVYKNGLTDLAAVINYVANQMQHLGGTGSYIDKVSGSTQEFLDGLKDADPAKTSLDGITSRLNAANKALNELQQQSSYPFKFDSGDLTNPLKLMDDAWAAVNNQITGAGTLTDDEKAKIQTLQGEIAKLIDAWDKANKAQSTGADGFNATQQATVDAWDKHMTDLNNLATAAGKGKEALKQMQDQITATKNATKDVQPFVAMASALHLNIPLMTQMAYSAELATLQSKDFSAMQEQLTKVQQEANEQFAQANALMSGGKGAQEAAQAQAQLNDKITQTAISLHSQGASWATAWAAADKLRAGIQALRDAEEAYALTLSEKSVMQTNELASALKNAATVGEGAYDALGQKFQLQAQLQSFYDQVLKETQGNTELAAAATTEFANALGRLNAAKATETIENMNTSILRMQDQIKLMANGGTDVDLDKMKDSFDFADIVKKTSDAIMASGLVLQYFNEDLQSGMDDIDSWADAMDRAQEKATQMATATAQAQVKIKNMVPQEDMFKTFATDVNQGAKSVSDSLAQMVENGKFDAAGLTKAFADMVTQMLSDFLRLKVIQPALNSLFDIDSSSKNATVGSGGGIGRFLSNLFGGDGGAADDGMAGMEGFASGGRPPSGVPSVVGEQGPELFTPDTPGTITPNSDLSSLAGGAQQIYVHLQVDTTPEMDARIINVSSKSTNAALASYTSKVLPSQVAALNRDPIRR